MELWFIPISIHGWARYIYITRSENLVIQSINSERREMNKIKVFPNGYATLEKLYPSGMYLVQCYKGTELHDKVRCDDYRMALDYYKAFSAIAKQA